MVNLDDSGNSTVAQGSFKLFKTLVANRGGYWAWPN